MSDNKTHEYLIRLRDVIVEEREFAKKLDMEVRKMISATEIQYNQAIQAKREKEDTIDLLKRALAYAEDQEIPF